MKVVVNGEEKELPVKYGSSEDDSEPQAPDQSVGTAEELDIDSGVPSELSNEDGDVVEVHDEL